MVGEPGTKEVYDRCPLVGRGLHIPTAVEVGDRLLVSQALDPQLADLALPQFVALDLGVFGENQGVEPVPVKASADPGPGPRGPAGSSSDLEVVPDLDVAVLVGSVVRAHGRFSFCIFGLRSIRN